jgi:hypothetical protein
VHDAHDDSENFLELLNSRTLAPELFAEPPACDYLKKMEYGSSHGGGGWPEHQFTAAALEKHLSSGYGAAVAHHHHHAAAGAPLPRQRQVKSGPRGCLRWRRPHGPYERQEVSTREEVARRDRHQATGAPLRQPGQVRTRPGGCLFRRPHGADRRVGTSRRAMQPSRAPRMEGGGPT